MVTLSINLWTQYWVGWPLAVLLEKALLQNQIGNFNYLKGDYEAAGHYFKNSFQLKPVCCKPNLVPRAMSKSDCWIIIFEYLWPQVLGLPK